MEDELEAKRIQDHWEDFKQGLPDFNTALHILANHMHSDSVRWFGDNQEEMSLTILILGLVGEAGEVADDLKKLTRGSVEFDDILPHMKEELIDVFHYWAMLIGALDIDFAEEYAKKREFNEVRFVEQRRAREARNHQSD